MKRRLRLPAEFAVLLVLLGSLYGCAALAPGADPVVVRAEQAETIGLQVVDAFLFLERAEWQHPGTAPYLHSASVHTFAEKIRGAECGEVPIPDCKDTAKHAFLQLTATKRAYKANRTAENKASLETWIATANQMLASAKTYMTAGGG